MRIPYKLIDALMYFLAVLLLIPLLLRLAEAVRSVGFYGD